MLRSFDYYKQIEDPVMYLCNPDRKYLGVIHATDRNIVLRFNDLCDFTFTVSEPINTAPSGEVMTIYNKVCTKRLVFIEQIGWFQIVSVNETDDGQYRYKEVTCQSHQIVLNNMSITTEERVYALYNPDDPRDELYDYNDDSAIPSVIGQLYQQLGILVNPGVSDATPTSDYGQWTIIYVSPSLTGLYRTLSDGVDFGYDFIKNKVAEAYDVVFEFDFLYHTIKAKKMSEFTTPTSIFLSFDNVVNELNIEENSEEIVTVLSCKGNNLDITTVNPMGTNYLVNFDYYMKELTTPSGEKEYPWMSSELINTIKAWKDFYNTQKDGYAEKVAKLEGLEKDNTGLAEKIQFAGLKIRDLEVIQTQFSTGEYDQNKNGLPVVEEVSVGEKSLKDTSQFYSTALADTAVFRGYKTAPNGVADETGRTKFSFEIQTDSLYGTASQMIEAYMPNESDKLTTSSAYLYFMDGDDYSYCKLNVDTEVGVSKDEAGVSAKADPNIDRFCTVGDVTFKVRKNSGSVNVYLPDGNGGYSSTVTTLGDKGQFNYAGKRYRAALSANDYASIYMYYVSGFRRYTMPVEVTKINGWLALWEAQLATLTEEDTSAKTDITALTEELKKISDGDAENNIKPCNIQKYIRQSENGDELYEEFSHYWVEGEFTNENFALSDNSTMAEAIELSKQLMESGEVELSRVSRPTYAMTVDAINFTNLIEFKSFTDQLALGKTVTVEKTEDELYEPALISMEFSLDDAEMFTLEFSNSANIKDGLATYADLVKSSSSTSRTVSANWSNLMEYNKDKKSIFDLINNPLDRSLRAGQANMFGQEFTVDDTGVLGRKYSDSSRVGFLPQQLRIANNQILFTDDAWESCKMALGLIEYEAGKSAYGIAAEVLVGKLLLGENLILSNSSNTIKLDENGITIKEKVTDAETGEEKEVTTFQADSTGSVKIRGDVYANSLTLAESIKVGTGHIDGIEDYAKKQGSYMQTDDFEEDESSDYAKTGMKVDLDNKYIKAPNFALTNAGTLLAKDLYNDVTAYEPTIKYSMSETTYKGCLVPLMRVGYKQSIDAQWGFTDGSETVIAAISGGKVSFDSTTFNAKVEGVHVSFKFIYANSTWTVNGTAVTIADYGIAFDNVTFVENDWFTIDYYTSIPSEMTMYAKLIKSLAAGESDTWAFGLFNGSFSDLKTYVDTNQKYPAN